MCQPIHPVATSTTIAVTSNEPLTVLLESEAGTVAVGLTGVEVDEVGLVVSGDTDPLAAGPVDRGADGLAGGADGEVVPGGGAGCGDGDG
jgi:hypothetical protein